MPRSGPNGTYTLPGAQDEAQPNTTIQSSINNQGWADIEQTFNTVQPISYGGTGQTDLVLPADKFGIKDSVDDSKRVAFDLSGVTTGNTRTLKVPDKGGTITTEGEVVAKSANYTVVEDDNGNVIAVDAAAAARTITLLPAATAGNGFKLVVKKADSSANIVTIDADGSETIDGDLNRVLRLQGQSVALICDGSGWQVMGEGTVFERGSNANGEYVRFADGTQICTRKITASSAISTAWGGIYYGDIFSSRAFPAAFAALHSINLMPESDGVQTLFLLVEGASSLSSWPFFRLARGVIDSASRSRTIFATAIGIWF